MQDTISIVVAKSSGNGNKWLRKSRSNDGVLKSCNLAWIGGSRVIQVSDGGVGDVLLYPPELEVSC